MNELILSSTKAPTKFSFKNAKLNEISAKIAEQSAAMNSVYNAAKEGAEAVNKALAPLFGELLTSKCYKDDGFKSVADYAEQTFNMSKSMAYMLARVGKEYHNEGDELTAKAVETLSTSKLNELTGVDRVAVAKAIENHELTADSSLAECREFAAKHKKPGKEKVLPTFTVAEMGYKSVIAENVIKEEMYEAIADSFAMDYGHDSPAAVMFATVKLDGDKPSAAQHFVAYDAAGHVEMYEYRPYVKAPIKGKGKGKEDFDLAAYIASLTPEQREALAAMAAGKVDGE